MQPAEWPCGGLPAPVVSSYAQNVERHAAVPRWQGLFVGFLAPLGFLSAFILMLLDDQGWLSEESAKWAAGACLAVGIVSLTVGLVLMVIRRVRRLEAEGDED